MEGRLSVYFRYAGKRKEKKENVGLDQSTTNRFATISSLAKGGSEKTYFSFFYLIFLKKFVVKRKNDRKL